MLHNGAIKENQLGTLCKKIINDSNFVRWKKERCHVGQWPSVVTDSVMFREWDFKTRHTRPVLEAK